MMAGFFGDVIKILRYLGQSPIDTRYTRNALMDKSKEKQEDGGSHVGPHASAGLQDVAFLTRLTHVEMHPDLCEGRVVAFPAHY